MVCSIVIPVLNEEAVLNATYRKLTEVMQSTKEPYELVFINDGSTDGSGGILKALAECDAHVKAVFFSRNFGHQAAVTCGMREAAGDAIVVIDCDLQDPPELIPELLEKFREGYDIVYGKRKKRRGETPFKKLTAFCYYRLMRSLSEVDVPADAGDFRLLSRKAADALNAMPEHNRYLRGMNAWAGFRQTAVEYERSERAAGKTKYTLRKMLKLASDGIVSGSKKPLRLAAKFGLFLLLLSVAALLSFTGVSIAAAVGATAFRLEAVWWAVAAMGFFTGCLLLSHGVTNSYVGRIYDEVQNRPQYIVSERFYRDGQNEK